MRGRLTIGGYHSNRVRFIVYFSASPYIYSCNLSIASREKECFIFLSCYHGNKA